MFYFILGVIITVIVLLIFKKLANKYKVYALKTHFFRIKIIYDFGSKIVFFNLILRLMLEGYLGFCIDSLINMLYVNNNC